MNRGKLWQIVAVPLLVVGFSCLLVESREPEPTYGLTYASILPANWDLFRVDGDSIQPLTRLPGLEYDATAHPDGRHVVFTSEQEGNPDLWIVDLEEGEPRPLYRSDVLEGGADISPDGDRIVFVSTRGGNAGIYLADLQPDDPDALDDALLLTPEEGDDFRPAISPDGRWIAYSSTRGLPFGAGSHLWIAPIDGGRDGQPRRIVSAEGWNSAPVWSEDGQSIVYHQLHRVPGQLRFVAGRAGVWQVEVSSGRRRRLSAEDRIAAYPARHPAGGWVWSEREEQTWRLRRWDPADSDSPAGGRLLEAGENLWQPTVLPTGQVVLQGEGPQPPGERLIPMLGPMIAGSHQHLRKAGDAALRMLPMRAAFPAVSPDRKALATGAMSLQLVDLGSGAARVALAPTQEPSGFPWIWAPDWSPDGRWLTVTVGAGFADPGAAVDVWRVGADGSDPVNLTADSPENDALATISPDGRWIAFRSGRDGQMDLYLADSDGSDIRRLTRDPAVDTMPSFSPDGRRIAFSSTRTGNYEVFVLALTEEGKATGSPVQVTDSPGMDVHPGWSPDGEWLVVTTDRWGWNDEIGFEPLNFQPYGELAAIRLADRHVVRLTHNTWEEGQGDWFEVPEGRD